MKKLLLILLVLACGSVQEMKATTLHIGVEPNFVNKEVHVYRFGGTGDTWGVNEPQATQDGYKYGRLWYHVDMGDNNSAVIRVNNKSEQTVNVTGISGENYYIYVSTTTSDGKYNAGQLLNPFIWNYMTFRQNIIDKDGNNGTTWSEVNDNSSSHPDGDTFTFELTKTQIDNSSNKAQGIRFRLRNGDMVYFNDAGDYINERPQLYPSSAGAALNIAANTTTYNHNTTYTDNYWQIDIPSYNYDKIVITAKYVNESGYKWKISADAYIAKTITSVGYATFGSGADVDFSGVAGVTAQKAKVNTTNGHITYTNATTLEAGEGVLLSGDAGTYYIPVAVSGDYADTEHNDFIGVTTTDVTGLKCDATYNYYILTNRIQSGATGADADLGFYKVNSTSGNNVRVGSAYLRTATGGAYSPEFFPLFSDSETTGINSIAKSKEPMAEGQVYNLNGQRVLNPTKGLYIVNGKKVIIK